MPPYPERIGHSKAARMETIGQIIVSIMFRLGRRNYENACYR